MRKKVLISAPYFQPVVKRFLPIFKKHDIELVIPRVRERLSEKQLFKLIGDIDGAICGDDAFTEKVLRAAARLKVISKWGTGIDSIDGEACRKFNIALKNTPNAFTVPVADSVLAYILCFARQTSFMDKHMKKGIWKKISGTSLKEKTLGVIGVGNIGQAVIRRAKAFSMRILANDIKPVDLKFIKETDIEIVPKDVIYKEAHFISLNCDLNPTSFHLLDRKVFSKMKQRPVIINTARGPIINERDLITALRRKMIAGAGLDVFEHEPLAKDSPLLKMDNVLLAPHNSNSSPAAWERVHENTLKNLLEVIGNHG